MTNGLGLAILLAAAPPVRAWNASTHQVIASAAVRLAAPDLQTAEVPAETLEHLLADRAFWPGGSDFARALGLNPAAADAAAPGEDIPDGYRKLGDFQLGERPGRPINAAKLLETYVVEPDWGMDQGVCELYACRKDELKHMYAGGKGLISQAFRHMYWRDYQTAGLGKHFLRKVTPRDGLGEAPARCQLFFDLSIRAAAAGHPYWAYRFLAWSMHYPQDVAQPFHASQIPSKFMLRFVKRTFRLFPSSKKTAALITRDHLAFETYMDDFAEDYTSAAPNDPLSGTPAEVTKTAASVGRSMAGRVGYASLLTFQDGPQELNFADPDSAKLCMIEAVRASISLLSLERARLSAASAPAAAFVLPDARRVADFSEDLAEGIENQ
ncbi:MAG: hypothetical protein ACHQ49_00300 [Elusimicrobiota bacterium]